MEPVVYIPALWIFNRAIVQRKTDDVLFVLRRLRCGPSREETSVELIPVDACYWEGVYNFDGIAQRIPIATLEEGFTSTNKIMSIARAPL